MSILAGNLFAYGYTKSLDPVFAKMLRGEFGEALNECSRLERGAADKAAKGEIFYVEGVCLFNMEYYEKARDAFRKAIPYIQKPLSTELYIGIADTYFMQHNYDDAVSIYDQLLTKGSDTDYQAMLFYKLGRAYQGKSELAKSEYYFSQLHKKFPESFEAQLAKATTVGGNFFTIQVGCFTSMENAQSLYDDLKSKGYEAYITPLESRKGKLYRVRVGEFASRLAAEYMENQLKDKENLPTHIFP